MKIFFVVGILLLAECIHRFSHKTNKDHESDNETLFVVFDVLNLSRGFFFFIIFICKKKVFVKIRKYFNSRNRPQINQARSTETELNQVLTLEIKSTSLYPKLQTSVKNCLLYFIQRSRNWRNSTASSINVCRQSSSNKHEKR